MARARTTGQAAKSFGLVNTYTILNLEFAGRFPISFVSQDYVADVFQRVELVQRSGVSTKRRNLRGTTMDEFRFITIREWQEQAEAQSKHEGVIGVERVNSGSCSPNSNFDW
jgi:hypothetical protein